MTDVLVAIVGGIALVLSVVVGRVDRRTRELKHNGGGSVKDDVTGLALSVGHLQRAHDETRERVDLVLVLLTEHLRRNP